MIDITNVMIELAEDITCNPEEIGFTKKDFNDVWKSEGKPDYIAVFRDKNKYKLRGISNRVVGICDGGDPDKALYTIVGIKDDFVYNHIIGEIFYREDNSYPFIKKGPLKLESYGSTHNIYLRTSTYTNNDNLYIGMLTDDEGYLEPWGNLTVNLGIKCDPDCGFVDVENNHGIEEFIETNNLGEKTDRLCQSGFVLFPEYKFNMTEITKHFYNPLK